jgi:hypothetical protein
MLVGYNKLNRDEQLKLAKELKNKKVYCYLNHFNICSEQCSNFRIEQENYIDLLDKIIECNNPPEDLYCIYCYNSIVSDNKEELERFIKIKNEI